jgi:hypothetical protein
MGVFSLKVMIMSPQFVEDLVASDIAAPVR